MLSSGSTCQSLSCESEVEMYRCDIRPCSSEFPALQGTTSGLDCGCLLPVMREVQGCDQHSRRGSGVEEGSGVRDGIKR